MTIPRVDDNFYNYDEQAQQALSQIASIDRTVDRIRVMAIFIILMSVGLLILGVYTLSNFTHLHFEQTTSALFILLIMIYALVTSGILFIMYRSINSSQGQQITLQSVLRNYQRRTDELRVAAQIARDASIGNDPDDIMQQATNLITARFGFYHAGIYLVDTEDDGRLCAVLRSVAGQVDKDALLGAKLYIHETENSVISNVIRRAKARVVMDAKLDPDFMSHPALQRTRSELTVPLRVGQEVIGALDVQNDVEGTFTQQDTVILQTLGDLLAVAINKATLKEAVQHHADDLENRVEERTQELAAERSQLSAILNSMTEGVMYYAGDNLIYTNQAFTNLLGYTTKTWDGMDTILKVRGLGDDDTQANRNKIYDMITHDGIWMGEVSLRRKNGTEFAAHVTGVRVYHGQDEPEGIVSIIRDISQEKALAEQRDRLVAYASHELRTPLANMKTQLYLMRKQPNKFQNHHDIMKEVIERMQRLVDDLLTSSRMEHGLIKINTGLYSLSEVVRKVGMLQQAEAENKNVQMTLHIPDDPIHTQFDHDRITQVITNLLSNAINYTPDGGTIRLSTQRSIEDNIVQVIVQDTGVGIPPDMLTQVFEPFFRVNNTTVKGSGLGLNISKQIVDMHKGRIFVESIIDEGTIFIVELPLSEDITIYARS